MRRFALLLRALLIGRFGSFPEAVPWLVFQFNYLLKREGMDLRLRAETPSINKALEVKFTKFMVLTRRKMHWGNVPYQRARSQLGGRYQQERWSLPYDVLSSKHKHQAAEKEMRNELDVIHTRLELATSQPCLLPCADPLELPLLRRWRSTRLATMASVQPSSTRGRCKSWWPTTSSLPTRSS